MRRHKYVRLDGSCRISSRRDTVAGFQSSEDIFVFLLSTRAGGLGINLTAADTVGSRGIFVTFIIFHIYFRHIYYFSHLFSSHLLFFVFIFVTFIIFRIYFRHIYFTLNKIII